MKGVYEHHLCRFRVTGLFCSAISLKAFLCLQCPAGSFGQLSIWLVDGKRHESIRQVDKGVAFSTHPPHLMQNLPFLSSLEFIGPLQQPWMSIACRDRNVAINERSMRAHLPIIEELLRDQCIGGNKAEVSSRSS